MLSKRDSFIAPTARIDSGQMSRSSNTKGLRFIAAAPQAATAVKNCGEVPMITSGLRTKSAARKPETMKLTKSRMRRAKPSLPVM